MNNKTLIILFSCLIILSWKLNAQRNVKPDNKIGKKELEISFIAGLSAGGALAGSNLVYRFPIGCKFKLGGGFHFSIDEEDGRSHPGIFLDLSKFVGNKQKWILNGQVGKGFYETTYESTGANSSYYINKQRKEIFYQFSTCYRMNFGKKVSFFTGPYFLVQTYKSSTEVRDFLGQQLNPFSGRIHDSGGGIRFGLTF